MISLISSALIMGLSPCQPLAHPRQLPVETAIYDVAADLGDEAPEQRRVDALLQKDPLAEGALEAPTQFPLLRIGERRRRAHSRAGLPEILIDEIPVGRHDLREVVDAAALCQETDEIADERP